MVVAERLGMTTIDPAGARATALGSADHLALLTGPDAAGLLAAAVGTAGGELLSALPRHVTHRPGVDTTVSYRARVRWPDGTEADETFAAATPVGEDAESGAALVLDDGAARVAVWRYPHDPALPGLPRACDTAAVAELLDRFGLGRGNVRLRTRAYRPRRRAVERARDQVAAVVAKAQAKLVEHHFFLSGEHLLGEAAATVNDAIGFDANQLAAQQLVARPLLIAVDADATVLDPALQTGARVIGKQLCDRLVQSFADQLVGYARL